MLKRFLREDASGQRDQIFGTKEIAQIIREKNTTQQRLFKSLKHPHQSQT